MGSQSGEPPRGRPWVTLMLRQGRSGHTRARGGPPLQCPKEPMWRVSASPKSTKPGGRASNLARGRINRRSQIGLGIPPQTSKGHVCMLHQCFGYRSSGRVWVFGVPSPHQFPGCRGRTRLPRCVVPRPRLVEPLGIPKGRTMDSSPGRRNSLANGMQNRVVLAVQRPPKVGGFELAWVQVGAGDRGGRSNGPGSRATQPGNVSFHVVDLSKARIPLA